MLVPVEKPKFQVQFLPHDSLRGVQLQLHSDIQTLGRIKSVCQYFNDVINIETILEPILINPSYDDFKLVEKFLYHQVPRIPVAGINDAQGLRKRCAAIINTHMQKIDSSIMQVYLPIKYGNFGKYFVDKLELTENDRIAFYFGKLPGQIKLDEELDFIQNDSIIDDILDAAHQDALYAAKAGNIARVRVVLNRYEQFAGFYELLEPLCKLGDSTILLDYLSIPKRGINYAEEVGFLTALDLAIFYGNKELEKTLLEHGA